MSKRFGVWVVIAILVATPTLGFAADGAMGSSWASEMGWGAQAKGKLVYGLKNVLLGWTELFTEPKDSLSEGTNFFAGIGRGIWNGVGQTVGGALHLVTFPITAIDVPLPEGGTQVL